MSLALAVPTATAQNLISPAGAPRTAGLAEAPLGQRPAGIGDAVLLTLGGVGGGIAAGLVAVSLEPVAARVTVYGLGVAAGTALTGRALGIDGSLPGALVGAAVGSGIVLLVAQDTEGEGLDAAASVGLLALVVPPVLSTAGYVLAPTRMGDGSPGLALRVDL